MRILIACDSFKDALPAAQVCRAIAEGLAGRARDLVEFPLADGGEGTFEVLAAHLGLRTIEVRVYDPLMRPLVAPYGLSADGATAVIEMAKASGLQLLSLAERDPLAASSFGAGQLVRDARARGAERIVLAIGGSATNDGGVGAAAAMGWQFLDAAGAVIEPRGGALGDIATIEPPQGTALKWATLTGLEVMCDVTNPLFGPTGASWTYGPQKGGDDASLSKLDTDLERLAGLVADQLGLVGLAEVPGAGAAGGLGFGAMAFMGGTLRRGIDLVLDVTGFDRALDGADLVITGEGHLDGQTLNGKLIEGVCTRAAARGVPVVALCGKLSATPEQVRSIGLRAAYSINPVERPLAQMLADTADNLKRTAAAMPLA